MAAEPREPIHLVRCLDYQDHSVVSRVLLKKPTGTVTLFAFDQDQELSEHTTPFDALAHVLDGEGEILINQQPYRLTVGQMLVLPANVPHAVKAPERFKMLLTMIRS